MDQLTVTDPADLLGPWRLRRRFVDRAAGLAGQAHGQLVVTPLVGVYGFRWQESGIISWSGASSRFTREYQLRPVDGRWWMTFADGSLFHPWTPGAPVEHPCVADLYRGRIVIGADATLMRILWQVTGPAKDQRILTRLHR